MHSCSVFVSRICDVCCQTNSNPPNTTIGTILKSNWHLLHQSPKYKCIAMKTGYPCVKQNMTVFLLMLSEAVSGA